MTSAGDRSRTRGELARLLTRIEAGDPAAQELLTALPAGTRQWVVGITGPPGTGKSTLTSALVTLLRSREERVAVLAVDPSSPHTYGAVLGDRIRMMQHVGDPGVFIRSLGSRGQVGGLSAAVPGFLRALAGAGFEWVLLETVGVGQVATDVSWCADTVVLVAPPGAGDAVQASKAGISEVADIFVVNKSDSEQAADTARDLAAALRLGTGRNGWRPPVLLTQADAGTGIDKVRDAIIDHRRHICEAGLADQSWERRRLAEWRERSSRLLMQRLEDAQTEPAVQALAEQVRTGKVGPEEAARRLIGLLPPLV